MIRFRLYYDKDKETAWLNQMAQDGYAMDGFFMGFYTFHPCEKGEWQYQVDIGQGFGKVSPSYSEFMEEMGVQIVQCWGPWVILRRKASEGDFALYTDVDSQIGQYKKIALLFKIMIMIELIILVMEVYVGTKNPVGYAFALLIAAFVVVFFNVLMKTKDIIAELRERKGEDVTKSPGRNVSPLVSAGLLINAAGLLMQDTLPTAVRGVLVMVALILILSGCIRTAHNK